MEKQTQTKRISVTRLIEVDKTGSGTGTYKASFDGKNVILAMRFKPDDLKTTTFEFTLPWGAIYGTWKEATREERAEKPKKGGEKK